MISDAVQKIINDNKDKIITEEIVDKYFDPIYPIERNESWVAYLEDKSTNKLIGMYYGILKKTNMVDSITLPRL